MNRGENLSLSLAEIEAYNGQGPGKPSGGRLRYFCPIHGGDKQRSLALDLKTGRFQCFACGAWGYTAESRECRREEYLQSLPPKKKTAPTRPAPPPPRPRKEAPPRADLAQALTEFQKALPGSLGEEYLKRRGIPLEVAQALGGGYAAPGKWPNPKRDWKWGRVIFPHHNPAGELVNLYGRAVGADEKVPKEKRHDHLPGAKGYFNAVALVQGGGPLYVCEGAFDALALIAAGAARAVAIFGVDGWRWEWVRNIWELVFCLDADERGQEERRKISRAAAMRGKRVFYLPPEALGGHKDLSAAWAADALHLDLSISGIAQAQANHNIWEEVSTWPPERREAWEERAAILEYENKMARPEAERAAYEMLRGSVGA